MKLGLLLLQLLLVGLHLQARKSKLTDLACSSRHAHLLAHTSDIGFATGS